MKQLCISVARDALGLDFERTRPLPSERFDEPTDRNGWARVLILAPAMDAMKLPSDRYPDQHSYMLYDLLVTRLEDAP